jgi:serine protease Do
VVVAVERAIPAVVDISTKKSIRVSVSPFTLFRTPFDDLLFPPGLFEDTYVGTSLGSGVIVDAKGHVITNNHVVTFGQGRRAGVADEIEVLLHGEDITRQAQIVGRESSEDIAILRLVGDPPSRYLPFGGSSDLMIGETVIAIGYALGQSHTVTQGIISQLGRFIDDGKGNTLLNLIQTDADINPGNSGGPLINLDGELVGINTAIATPSGGSVGIGFAIPVNRVRKIYSYYVLGKPSLEQRLGIQVQGFYPRLRAALRESVPGFQDVKDLHGVLVMYVEPGGPASEVIDRYDVIQGVNGKRIESSDDITTELVPATDTSVRLDILRQGEKGTLTAKLRSSGGGYRELGGRRR